jgi:rRNA maturation endonuclease Nob1
MVMIAIALILVACAAFIAYPLFVQARGDDASFMVGGDPIWENLVVQRDAAYTAIKDLENDHGMGKLSDVDYKTLRAKYESKAVAVLQEIDGLRASNGGNHAADDETIERQVQQMRGGSRRLRCSKCGTRAAPNDRFCAKCGAAISRVTA